MENSVLQQKKNIFLVDDDPTNLTCGKNALGELYNAFTFNSSQRFFKMLENTIPDLILLDVEMPEMSGYEIIKILKSNRKTANIPVIFLTAKNDYDNELEGLSLGAVDYIKKPFSAALLLKRLEIHLKLVDFNHNLQEMVEEKTKNVLMLQNAILKVMAELVECRDDITGGHIERTQNYLAVLIGAMIENKLYEQEISQWNIKLVLRSAQLHDVGKIAISDNILNKPGKLTEEEFETMKTHTTFGEKIIDKVKQETTGGQEFLNHAGIFAATHHEKWDGSGYPKGLKGEEIPLEGRLMAIADVYDALVCERPYKKAFSHEDAVKIITDGKGKHFAPDLVDLFLSVAEKFEEIRAAKQLRERICDVDI